MKFLGDCVFEALQVLSSLLSPLVCQAANTTTHIVTRSQPIIIEHYSRTSHIRFMTDTRVTWICLNITCRKKSFLGNLLKNFFVDLLTIKCVNPRNYVRGVLDTIISVSRLRVLFHYCYKVLPIQNSTVLERHRAKQNLLRSF